MKNIIYIYFYTYICIRREEETLLVIIQYSVFLKVSSVKLAQSKMLTYQKVLKILNFVLYINPNKCALALTLTVST